MQRFASCGATDNMRASDVGLGGALRPDQGQQEFRFLGFNSRRRKVPPAITYLELHDCAEFSVSFSLAACTSHW